MKRKLSKAFWYVKQLMPLTYWTNYRDGGNRRHFAIWRMWFGKVFSHTDVVVD